MNSTRVTSALVWKTPTGRKLIQLDEGGHEATVTISGASEAELRALASAAIEAADQIKAYAANAVVDAALFDEGAKPSDTFVAFNRDDKLSEALQAVGL